MEHRLRETAEDEYTDFEGTEVRIEKRRMWVGYPHHKYVMRDVVVRDLGRPKRVEESALPLVGTGIKRGSRASYGSNIPLVEKWLEENGPHTIRAISKLIDASQGSIRYACSVSTKIGHNIFTDEWGVVT